jgi:transcriptional regulator with XRE-family HTH domain
VLVAHHNVHQRSYPHPEAALKLLGATIRSYREQQEHLTQETLATQTGLSLNYISEIERGLRNVSVLNLLRIAAVLRIPVAQLLQPLESSPELYLPHRE